MANHTVPSPDFKTEIATTKVADAIKAAGASKLGDLIKVPVTAVTVVDGYNVRVRDTDSYKEGIEQLKGSIAANGFYADKPLGVYAGKNDKGEDAIFLRSGHRRLEAVEALNFERDKDAQIEVLPCVLVPAATTLEEHLVELVQGNSGKDLTPFEKGVVVKRLMGIGMEKPAIAEKLGYSTRYIDDLLVIAGSPVAVRNLILEEKVSSTQALRELRKDSAKAPAVLKDMVSKAESKGKSKATAGDKKARMSKTAVIVNFGKGDSLKEVLRTMAAQVREVIKEADDLIATSGSVSLTIAVPAVKKAAAAKAKTTAAAKDAKLLPDPTGAAAPTEEQVEASDDPLAHALGVDGAEPEGTESANEMPDDLPTGTEPEAPSDL